MDVAVAEEPQKKIFRARKTMKISDRQQLESLHNTLSSSSSSSVSKAPCASPPLVNGRHPEEGQKETEREKEKEKEREREKEKEKTSAASSPAGPRSVSPASRSPTPLALSLSLSPSPPAKAPEEEAVAAASPPSSPATPSGGKGAETTGKGGKAKAPASPLAKDGEKVEEEGLVKVSTSAEEKKEDGPPKPQRSPTGSPAAVEAGQDGGVEATEVDKTIGTDMDTAPSNGVPEDVTPILDKMAAAAAASSSLAQSPGPPGNTTASSPSLSPSHAPESDQEVREGFLVLSEEEEPQVEKEDEKEKEEEVEKMETEEKETEEEESAGTTAQPASPPPASPAPSPGEAGAESDAGAVSGRKRAMPGDVAEADGSAESGEKEQAECREGPENQRKRPRVERDELEAHIELKISGNADTRHKLEKVVQQLVAEQLRVLQLSVFDRSLQELRERVEKIDCTTKHQHTLDSLQAKIARLTKKFGAANQAKENLRKPQEITVSSIASSATTHGSPTQRIVRSVQESKRTEQAPSPASTTGQSKVLPASSPASSSSVAPPTGASLINTSSSAPSATSVTTAPPSAPQNQAAKLNPPGSPAAPSTPPSKPMSLQPLLFQLPLTVTSGQGGTLVANHSSGVELVPVTSLSGTSPLNKAKTTTAPAATFIIQKTVPPASSSSPSLPQITLARAAVHPGSSGMVTSPGPAVSVTSARTPAQCAPAVGATSASSPPSSSTPAATGGQSSGATASAPLSGAAMASKTDTQATSRAPDSTTAKSPAQAPRGSRAGAVIDLTEDDDDVLVTGVKKAPVQTAPTVSASPSSSSPSSVGQRAPGGPPPLNSHATNSTMHTQPSAQTTVNGSQRCQAVAPSPSRVLPHSSSSSKSSVSLPSSGAGAVGGVRVAVGVTAAVGGNRQGSPQATGTTVRSSPQSTQHLNGPQLTVHHRPLQETQSKSLPSSSSSSSSSGAGPGQGSAHGPASLPPLPSSPAATLRLPPEAAHTSPPQQPQLKLARVQSQNGIVLSWCVEAADRSCAAVDSYHLYAYHQDQAGPAGAAPASQWKKIGEVKALPLPMACTLTQFVSGSKYYFAVRARDVYGRFGPFCEPQCTDVITPSSSSSSSSTATSSSS